MDNAAVQFRSSHIPSRFGNPFATCWTKPGALAYQFEDGESAHTLIARLERTNWWGEIRGPHGAGKTTLLATLTPLLAGAGRPVAQFTLHSGVRRLSQTELRQALSRRSAIVVVDGYEQLSWLRRLRVRAECRRAAAGLLVTSHTATELPLLVELQPDIATLRQLVDILTSAIPSPVTIDDIVASHASHGSNVRDCLFELYDRHERSIRASRTATHTLAY
jgi:hypothetical protein